MNLQVTGNDAGTYHITITNTQVLNKYWGYPTKTKIPIFTDKNLRSFNPQIINGSVILTKTCPDIKLRYFTYQPVGDEIILKWSVLNADSVSLSDGAFGMGTHPPEGQYRTSIETKTQFFLSARNECETRQYSLIAEAPKCEKPIIKTFSVDKTDIVEGQGIKLTWRVQNVSQAHISNIGRVDNTGAMALTPVADQTYKISAENNCGAVERELSVTVAPKKTCTVVPGINFSASETTIYSGDTTALNWKVSGAKTVTISGVGEVESQGTLEVVPKEKTRYLLTATNDCGQSSAQVWITVEEPPCKVAPGIRSFTADKQVIKAGETVTLSWEVTEAEKVHILGVGEVPATGTAQVSPTERTRYLMTTENKCGQAYGQVWITVDATKPPPVPPVCKVSPGIRAFTADRSIIKTGEVAVLSWEVVGAETVTITKIGEVGATGTARVSPAERTQYLLVAENPCGKASAQAWIDIETPRPPNGNHKQCFIGSLF